MHFVQFYPFGLGLIFLFTIQLCNTQSICDLPNCVGINPTSIIFTFCEGLGHHINSSCCFDKDSKVLLGLDLNGCSITDTSKYLDTLTTVEYMSLRGSDVNCSTNNFKGMINLRNLWLSDKCNFTCPGGDTAWHDESSNKCENQTDLCKKYNFTCPENSKCANNGPGLFHCICADSYYGYKCTRKGEFPVTIFTACLSTATVVTSAVLWFLTLKKTVILPVEPMQ
uniref:EGF-like domain-containing protein n=1 Tax=Strigamia maritima TaxID=126957 RepID=T1J0B5_STRMM